MSRLDGVDPSAEDEVMQIQFKTSGFLNFLIRFLKPFLRAQPPRSAHIAGGCLVKDIGKPAPLSLALSEVERVYWNTTSDSFAFVARGERSGLLIPLVVNARELAQHVAGLGIPVEQEMTSPRRRFLD